MKRIICWIMGHRLKTYNDWIAFSLGKPINCWICGKKLNVIENGLNTKIINQLQKEKGGE